MGQNSSINQLLKVQLLFFLLSLLLHLRSEAARAEVEAIPAHAQRCSVKSATFHGEHADAGLITLGIDADQRSDGHPRCYNYIKENWKSQSKSRGYESKKSVIQSEWMIYLIEANCRTLEERRKRLVTKRPVSSSYRVWNSTKETYGRLGHYMEENNNNNTRKSSNDDHGVALSRSVWKITRLWITVSSWVDWQRFLEIFLQHSLSDCWGFLTAVQFSNKPAFLTNNII